MQVMVSPEQMLPRSIWKPCLAIAAAVRRHGGRARLVGGCVRDALLGSPSKDVDIEVFGIDAETLRTALRQEFQIIEVGASFGVFKLRGHDIDVSIPRRESKSGSGHKGFLVEGDPQMSVEEAGRRRDFTLNAIYYDLDDGEILDPHGGLRDLEKRILRHTSDQFREDPLRVLRGMQFIARFNLQPAEETIAVCRGMGWEDLPEERVFEEWKKLLLKGKNIYAGLEFLRETGWVRFFPELESLIGCPQDPEWHPEGDVWTHTAHCLNAYAGLRINDEYEDLIVGLGVLCHDLGKPATTVLGEDGRYRSPAHDTAGEAPTRSFLERLTRQKSIHDDVVPLVLTHMQPSAMYKSGAGKSAIRRLATRVRIDRLVRVVRADMRGSPPKQRDESACDWLLEQARDLALEAAAPKPIIQGRHLIALGLKPGKHFGAILDRLFEAQLEGAFLDEEEGLRYTRQIVALEKEKGFQGE